jgi:hypothetical protein
MYTLTFKCLQNYNEKIQAIFPFQRGSVNYVTNYLLKLGNAPA